jgi:hypothetical protein
MPKVPSLKGLPKRSDPPAASTTRVVSSKDRPGNSPPPVHVPFKRITKGTEEQEAIWKAMTSGSTGHILVDAKAGTGKEQPVDCLVQTPRGPVPIGCLSVGDVIFASSGSLQHVVGVYPQGVKQSYRVSFRDGAVTRCGHEHLWLLTNKGKYANREKVVPLSYMLGNVTNSEGDCKHRIPLCQAVRYEPREYLIDPYLLGLLIGNGYLSGNTPAISFNAEDTGILEEFHKIVSRSQLRTALRCTGGDGLQTTLVPDDKLRHNSENWLTVELRRLGLNVKSPEKDIPKEYLIGSVDQRRRLLAGLMDTDGSCRENRTSYSTTSFNLAMAVRTLVQSLGGTAILALPDTRYKHTCYTVNVKMFESPFGVSSKSASWHPSAKNPPSRYITAIEPDGPCEQVCIKVSSSDSLYLTDEFVCTHNTTTMVEGLYRDKLSPMRGRSRAMFVFGKANGQKLKQDVPPGVTAGTMHSAMFRVLRDAVKVPDRPNFDQTRDIIRDLWPNYRFPKGSFWALQKLVRLAKNVGITLEEIQQPTGFLEEIAARFSVSSTMAESELLDKANKVLEASVDLDDVRHTGIDFDSMLWLPYVLNLKPRRQFDYVIVDELQDLTPVQQHNALSLGKSLWGVGDPQQSVMGFRGGDTDSINTMRAKLGGFTEFPLTICWRCPTEVIALAQRLVPEIRARPGAPAGEVLEIDPDSALDEVGPGDMILCRTNAPLIPTLFRLWSKNVRAFVQGRQYGQDLLDIVTAEEYYGISIDELINRLQVRQAEEENRLIQHGSPESAVAFLQDKFDCLYEMARHSSAADPRQGVQQLKDRLNFLFTDEGGPDKVCLSSIHRAKGLEAPTVVLIEPHLLPHMMAIAPWEQVQEAHLNYVAVTRAMNRFLVAGSMPRMLT